MGNTMGRGVLLVFCAIFAVVFGAGGYWAGLRPLAETAQAAWTVCEMGSLDSHLLPPGC